MFFDAAVVCLRFGHWIAAKMKKSGNSRLGATFDVFAVRACHIKSISSYVPVAHDDKAYYYVEHGEQKA